MKKTLFPLISALAVTACLAGCTAKHVPDTSPIPIGTDGPPIDADLPESTPGARINGMARGIGEDLGSLGRGIGDAIRDMGDKMGMD